MSSLSSLALTIMTGSWVAVKVSRIILSTAMPSNVGHHDVQQDKIKSVLLHQCQGFLPTRSSSGRIPFAFETTTQHITVMLVVIHDQERTKSRCHTEPLS